MAKDKQPSKRNLVRQEVPLKDKEGNVIGTKAIFHMKPTHAPHYANRKELWDSWNKTPKENSKRQQKIRAERLRQLVAAQASVATEDASSAGADNKK